VKASPYNAKGDNSTDDSAAFQAAIDVATGATNAEVDIFVPGGRYIINSALNFGTKRVRFIGEGGTTYGDPRHGSVLKTGTNGMTLLNIDAGGSLNPAGPKFENLMLYDAALGSTLVSITNTNRVFFRDVMFAANTNADGTIGFASTFPGGGDCSWHDFTNCTYYNLTSMFAPTKCLGVVVTGGSFNGCATNMNLLGNAAHWRVTDVKADGGAFICYGAWNTFKGIKWEVQSSTAVQGFLIDYDGATTNSGQYNSVFGLTMNANGGSSVNGLKLSTNALCKYNAIYGFSAAGFADETHGCAVANQNVIEFLNPNSSYGMRYDNGIGNFVQSASPGTSGIAVGSKWTDIDDGQFYVFQSGAWHAVTVS
jgi:hypothetical protein